MTLPRFALISSGLTPTLHPSLNRKCLSLVENDLLFFRVTNALFLMKQTNKKTHKKVKTHRMPPPQSDLIFR